MEKQFGTANHAFTGVEPDAERRAVYRSADDGWIADTTAVNTILAVARGSVVLNPGGDVSVAPRRAAAHVVAHVRCCRIALAMNSGPLSLPMCFGTLRMRNDFASTSIAFSAAMLRSTSNVKHSRMYSSTIDSHFIARLLQFGRGWLSRTEARRRKGIEGKRRVAGGQLAPSLPRNVTEPHR